MKKKPILTDLENQLPLSIKLWNNKENIKEGDISLGVPDPLFIASNSWPKYEEVEEDNSNTISKTIAPMDTDVKIEISSQVESIETPTVVTEKELKSEALIEAPPVKIADKVPVDLLSNKIETDAVENPKVIQEKKNKPSPVAAIPKITKTQIKATKEKTTQAETPDENTKPKKIKKETIGVSVKGRKKINSIPLPVEPKNEELTEKPEIENAMITEDQNPEPKIKSSRKPRSIKSEQTQNESIHFEHVESNEFIQWLIKLGGTTEKVKKPKTPKGINIKPKPKKIKSPIEQRIESSLELGEEVVSETLAKILVRQGHKDQAIEMYEKLALKYPQKRVIFAATIEKLKS